MAIGSSPLVGEQHGSVPPGLAEPLTSFVPIEMLGRITRLVAEPPAVVTLCAAVIFVDVSRYTALVEQLVHRGHGGLEKVPAVVGRIYSEFLDRIYESGGEVLWFAGDTLVGYWAADQCGLGHAVRAAATCAGAICSEDAASDKTGPAVHIGIGAGRLWVAALGGEPLWNLLAAGEAVTQAAAAHSEAKPGKYVLSREAKRALQASSDSLPLEFRCTRTNPPASDWVARFVPPQIRNIFSAPLLRGHSAERAPTARRNEEIEILARLEALAELRPVTVLFARIIGLAHRGPEALPLYHQLCTRLQQELRVRGGPAGELVVDDKGLVFVAVFGAHGAFHRDDAARALYAALGIAGTLQRFGLSAGIGVATGGAVFRVAGNAHRRQLLVFGTPMNRAARLMASASSEILCDGPTERASRTAFCFENRGTLQLEGLGDTAAIFRPFKSQAAVTSAPRQIGRQNELQILTSAFDEVRNGQRHAIVIMGEPGIGKSTLVVAFGERLSAAGISISIARAERDDRRTSLLAWRRVLACLVGVGPDSEGPQVFESIAARIRGDSAIEARLPLLGDVLASDIAQSAATRHLVGAHRADATMRLVADLIERLAPQPTAIVLEDSQWLDSASWRLVEWVLASLPPLLLILCVRSEEVPEELKILMRRAEALRSNRTMADAADPARHLRIVDLTELGAEAIAAVAARILGEVPPHPDVARHVALLAGGNPLFAEEITLALKSEGLVAVRDGLWRPIRPLHEFRHFDGVERTIRERVDRLPAGPQRVLRAAAVAGRSFSGEAVALLLQNELDRNAVNAAFELLATAHLVRAGTEPGKYEFRHDEIRDVIYDSIPADVRQKLHRILADWIESSQEFASGGDIAPLVQHFEAAGDTVKAVRYADIAATQALQTGAFREVRAFLEICFRHEPRQQLLTPEQRLQLVRWRRQLGEAHYHVGDIHAQGVAVRRALMLAGEPVPATSVALLNRFIINGTRLLLQEIFPRPRDQVTGDSRAWEQELTRCFSQAAAVDYFEVRFLRAFYDTLAAVIHAKRAGSSAEEALAAAQFAVAVGIAGWHRLAQRFIARAERHATTLQDPAIESQVCNLDGLWRIGLGDWSAVDQRLRQAQNSALAAGDYLTWCNAQAIRFWLHYYRGELDALEQTAQSLLSHAQNSGNIQQEVWALRCKALCALYADRPREAVEFLRLSTEASRGSADLSERVSVTGVLAQALARIGLHAESVRAAVETLDLLRKVQMPTVHSTLPGLAGIGEVFFRGREAGLSRDYDQWSSWERRSLYELKRHSRVFPVGAAKYGLWAGVSYWLDGKRERAASTWKHSLDIACRLSLRQDQSLISAEMRRHHLSH